MIYCKFYCHRILNQHFCSCIWCKCLVLSDLLGNFILPLCCNSYSHVVIVKLEHVWLSKSVPHSVKYFQYSLCKVPNSKTHHWAGEMSSIVKIRCTHNNVAASVHMTICLHGCVQVLHAWNWLAYYWQYVKWTSSSLNQVENWELVDWPARDHNQFISRW